MLKQLIICLAYLAVSLSAFLNKIEVKLEEEGT